MQGERRDRPHRSARTPWCARCVLSLQISFSATNGTADAMIVSHFPHGPTVYFTLSNVNLRHDIGSYKNSTVSEQYPHLIFEGFTSKLGERIRDVLKYLFPVPKEDSKRVMTFSNEDDFISFRCVKSAPVGLELNCGCRHHVFVKIPPKQVQLAEVGPRFEMKRTLCPATRTRLPAHKLA